MLFQLSGRGNSNNDAMPDFVPDSNSSILGLSNDMSFVSGNLFEKWLKLNFKTFENHQKI